jgi:Ala-tRNA(Pro) deacylase
MDRSEEILSRLDSSGIPYRLFTHEPKWTIEDCLKVEGLDKRIATIPKNILLTNRQGTDFYLLLLSPERAFRTTVVSKLLGISRLSFAGEELLNPLLGLDKGAVSPLGLMFDKEQKVRLVMDEALTAYPSLWFHPGVNTLSLQMATVDFLNRFLPGTGHIPALISIPE